MRWIPVEGTIPFYGYVNRTIVKMSDCIYSAKGSSVFVSSESCLAPRFCQLCLSAVWCWPYIMEIPVG